VVAEEFGEISLGGCCGQQVLATHHLVDAREDIVDDHRQVVCRNTVITPQHDVIYLGRDLPMQDVVDGLPRSVGSQPERRLPR